MTFVGLERPTPVTRNHIRNLNTIASTAVPDLRLEHRRWMERLYLHHLTSSEFVVLSAIVSRTFSWRKVIEVIPLSTLSEGMRETGDPLTLLMSENGLPYFSGTGLDKTTIRKAIAGLLAHGLVSRYAIQSGGRDIFAYMPVSTRTLVLALARNPRFPLDTIPEPFTMVRPVLGPLERSFADQFGGDALASRIFSPRPV